MDNRIAWRLVDFWKDIFMHHRKFTPFQKLVFLTFLVGILIGIFRNISALGIAVTYALAIYLSVTTAGFILNRREFLPSDVLVENYNHIQDVLSDYFLLKNVNDNDEIADKNGTFYTQSSESTDTLNEDQYFDAPENIVSHNLNSMTPKKHSNNHRVSPQRDKGEFSKEIECILNYIHRDFIQSWYKLFSTDEEGLMEAELLLHNIFIEISVRVSKLDRFELASMIMTMFSNHIHKVKQAQLMLKAQKKRRRSSVIPKSNSENSLPSLNKTPNANYKTVEECFSAKSELHPAARNKELEQMHQKSVVEIVLLNVLEENLTETKTLICALKEILMCNVLQSVISLLSDTIFLQEKIIQITSDEQLFFCKENELAIHVVGNHSDSAVKLKSALNSSLNSHGSSEKNADKEKHVPVCAKVSDKIEELVHQEEKPSTSVDEETPKETKWREDIKEFSISKGMCNECNRLCSKDKDKISPRPHTCSLGTTPVFFDADRLSIDSFESFDSIPRSISPNSESEKGDIPSTENIPGIKIDGSPVNDDVFVDQVSDTSNKTSQDQTNDGQLTSEQSEEESNVENGNKNVPNMLFSLIPNPLNAIPMLRKRSNSGLSSRNRSSPSLESSEERLDNLSVRKSISADEMHKDQLTPTTPIEDIPWPIDGPSVFQDIRIAGTETAKEPNGSSIYTLYLIDYEALYQTEETLVHRTGTVKRRFREFVNLQSRLEDNPDYKDSLKDVKGPKKLIPSLPFGNMGKDTLENRKKLLETFLSTLILRPVICNGSELKQFLGYSGDGHIAFVRKNPEAPSRIDQRLVKTMSGVFDKIVEGFPSLPPQLPRIMTSSNIKEDKEEDIKPLEDLDQLEIDMDCDQCHNQQKINSGLDKFMATTLFDLVVENKEQAGETTLGVSVLGWQEDTSTDTIKDESTSHLPNQLNSPKEFDHDDCPLTSAVLDILSELLHGEDSWICRENVTHSTKVLLGKALNRYIQSKVEKLTSDEMNTFYLRTLRETLWPNGQLDVDPRPVYTDGQKEILKKQAERCLAEFLPSILQTLLGMDDFSHLIDEVFNTIQYEKLNRHFWYSVIDILLEKLFPEVSSTDLQRRLSMSV